MAGIKSPILDIIAKLQTSSIGEFVRIWNNQFALAEGGDTYSFPFPCAFVEPILPVNYDQLAAGFTATDVTFRIHIGQIEYDSQDGNLEQNVSIFDLRDEVIRLLTYFKPTACGNLMKTAEQQDYEHTNVYHYTIDFICQFIDNKGDQTQGQITSGPPTTLEINPITIVTEITN